MIVELISDYYLLIKALHIISIICWMAGLLYLPRLFVYHAGAEAGSDLDKTFKQMEYRLLYYIMNPSMICSFVFGLPLILLFEFKLSGWLHIKILLVFILFLLHVVMIKHQKNFANGLNKKSSNFYRILNEGPTVLMLAIVLIVVLKPF